MSNLFGNLSNTQNKPSPFGATNASQSGSTLFGSLNQPATTSSLFASLGSTAQPQSQQQPGTGGAFGSGLSTQPQQIGGSSFAGFGGKEAQQQQQPQGAGSTLGSFGATTQQQQHNGSSILGGSTLQPQQRQDAYFDTILERSRKRALGESAEGDFPQLQLGLGDLRERIKRLASSKPDQSVDGKAHYLLAASGVDPGAAVRDLNQFSATASRAEKSQSQDAPDTDIEGYLANIQTQTTLSMISDSLARSVRDFDAFLEDNVTMEWDAQRRRIYQHFGIKPKDSIVGGGKSSFAASASETQGAFGKSRRSKAASLAGSRAAVRTSRDSGKFSGQRSVIGVAGPIAGGNQPLFADVEKSMEANGIMGPGPNDRFQRERQGRLAEKVRNLNEARLQKRCYPILHEFAGVVKLSAETHSEKVYNAYGALIEMTQENPEAELQSDPLALKERQFAAAYLDEDTNSSKSREVRTKIIRGSARFLEKQFFEKVEASVAKAPREANLGGIPDVLSKVKAYVRLKAARRDLAPDNSDLLMISDDYVWPLIYYLLRSGHVQEALKYVSDNGYAFRNIDRNFTTYIREYANSSNRTLNRDLHNRINNEYNQRKQVAPENSVDPYRMACYKIIGRCEIQNRTMDGIGQDMEDYMWLQFVLAREFKSTDTLANEACTLADAQKVIRDIGSRFFTKTKDTDYATFFWLQILGGLFEEAIAYMLHYAPTDAVHVAIALDYYGLLRVSDPYGADDDFLSQNTRELPQLNFGRMVGLYTRDFRAANVVAAVDYLCLICLNQDLAGDAGRQQVALCHDALREVVLESREFALLLGDTTTDGERISGAIEVRQKLIALGTTDEFMRVLTTHAASIADDNGRTTDAVLLYHLAEEYDNVLVIITRALSEAITTPLGQEQFRLEPLKPRAVTEADRPRGSLSLLSLDDPYSLAETITKIYEGKHMYMSKIKPETLDDCKSLMELCVAKALVERGQWTEALDVSLPFPLPLGRVLTLL